MESRPVILYVHGMGGGGDSRIPALLGNLIDRRFGSDPTRPLVVVRTYSFDPEQAIEEVSAWMNELSPKLVIGESLGAVLAVRLRGVPHLLVSPSLGAPRYFHRLAFLTLIPGVPALMGRIWRPKEGDRQKLSFTYRILRHFKGHIEDALMNSPLYGSSDSFFAFFGKKDHYRKSGVVSIKTYSKYFGNNFQLYDGTHFMEEEFVESLLFPKALSELEKRSRG